MLIPESGEREQSRSWHIRGSYEKPRVPICEMEVLARTVDLDLLQMQSLSSGHVTYMGLPIQL